MQDDEDFSSSLQHRFLRGGRGGRGGGWECSLSSQLEGSNEVSDVIVDGVVRGSSREDNNGIVEGLIMA